jgi:hypothetical protein
MGVGRDGKFNRIGFVSFGLGDLVFDGPFRLYNRNTLYQNVNVSTLEIDQLLLLL